MEDKPKLYLKAPARKWLWVGAAAASILPVIWGTSILARYIGYFAQGCYHKRLIGPCRQFSDAEFFDVPIGLTLIFGTLLAAVLGCRYVTKKYAEGARFRWVFIGIGVKSAAIAHFIFALLHITFLLVKSSAFELHSIVVVAGMGVFIHPIIWLFVTFPISIFCGFIFSLVATKRRVNPVP